MSADSRYIGRFAPTPSGELHLGSLAAAVISWLDARANGGLWHVRIDDLDPPRVVPNAADSILQTLERFGLCWDGTVTYQSHRVEHYREALAILNERNRIFPCACTRAELATRGTPGWEGAIYPGTCREGLPPGRIPRSFRFRVQQRYWTLQDRALGPVSFDLHRLGGDFVVRRADGLYAYQLATVVDDAELGVTDVVRGIDLLASAPRQVALANALGFAVPRYLHHPVLVAAVARSGGEDDAPKSSKGCLSKAAEEDGLEFGSATERTPENTSESSTTEQASRKTRTLFRKLGKSTGAPPVTREDPVPLLIALLRRLQVDLPTDADLASEPVAMVLDLARQNWRLEDLPAGDIRISGEVRVPGERLAQGLRSMSR